MEFRWPAGWPELPFASQLQQGSLEVTSCLPGRPKLRTVVRIFVPEPLEGTATDTTTSQVLPTEVTQRIEGRHFIFLFFYYFFFFFSLQPY